MTIRRLLKRDLDHRGGIARILAGLVMAVAAWVHLAGPPSLEAQQYNVHRYSNEEGLPQSQVLAMHQGQQGYLWFGTYGGLARFNGVDFVTLTSAAGLSSNVIGALAQDPDGGLWIGAVGGGICRVDQPAAPFPPAGDPGVECFDGEPSLPEGDIHHLVIDADGVLWIGAAGGLGRVDGRSFQRWTTEDGLPAGGVQHLVPGTGGDLWLGTAEGLLRLDLTAMDEAGQAGALPLHPVTSEGLATLPIDLLYGLPSGVLAASPAGVFLVSGPDHPSGPAEPVIDTILTLPSGALPADIRFRDAVRTPDGMIWVATTHGLVRWGSADDVERLTTAHGLPWDDLTGVLVDREGTVWVGSDDGAAAFVPGPFRAYGEAEGLPNSFVRALTEDAEGRVWAGTRSGVAVRDPDQAVFQVALTGDDLPDGRFFSAAPAPGGVLLGEATGLLYLESGWSVEESPGVAGRILGVTDGLPEPTAYSLEPDPTEPGAIWVATLGGVVRWRDGGVESFPRDHPLAELPATSLATDPEGRLWIGLMEGGVAMWDGAVLHPMGPEEGLTRQIVWDLARAPDGSIWAGTNGDGALRIREAPGGTWQVDVVGGPQGLADPFVWQTLADGAGRVWLYTNRGLYRWEDGSFSHFGRADGLADLEGAAAAAVEGTDGQLWFGSSQGVTVFDPAAVQGQRVPPPVQVEEAWLGSQPLGEGAEFRMRSELLQLRYAALTFRDAGSVSYRHRLVRGREGTTIDEDSVMDGGGTGWSEPTAARGVSLAGLPPGRYTFQVQAVTPDGMASDDAGSFSFRVEPAFWQTWWFMLLVGGLVVGLAALVPVLRNRQIEAERRRIARELRASESRLREIVENTSNVFYSHTPNHELTYISPTVEAVLGVPASQVPERWTSLADLDHPVTQAGMEHTERALRTGVRQPPYELVLRHDQGHEVWVRVIESPVVKDGEVMGLVGSLTDITETRKAEEEQERLEAQLEQARRMEAVGRLAGGIAHDFNNLLTTIMGHVNLIALDLEEGDPLLEDLEEVGEACDRAAGLVAQLLAIGRRQVARPTSLDVNRIMGERARMFRRVVGSSIEIETVLCDDEVEVVMDESQLDQILLNLVVNARDAMPDGGHLRLGTRVQEVEAPRPGWEMEEFVPGRFVVLEVADSGVGMDPEVAEHIFEPFYTTKPMGEGSGLGLSTVYGIARQNRGHVEVETAPGEGACFRVWIPAG